MKGTTISETLAIRLMPPMMTRPAQTVTIRPTTMVVMVMGVSLVVPAARVKTTWALSGSKKFWAAEVMPLIWVMVPMPRAPARTPNRAKSLPIHFHFLPMPFSI